MAISDHFCAHKFKSVTTSLRYFSPRIPKIENVWTLDFRKWGQKDIYTVPHKNVLRYVQTDRHFDF